MWEGFIEAFLLEGVDFLGREDRVLIFVAEEEYSLEGGDDGWFEVLFFKVEQGGLLLSKVPEMEREGTMGWVTARWQR